MPFSPQQRDLATARGLALLMAEGVAEFVERAKGKVPDTRQSELEQISKNVTDYAIVMDGMLDAAVPVVSVLPTSPIENAQALIKALDKLDKLPDCAAIANIGKTVAANWLTAIEGVLDDVLKGNAVHPATVPIRFTKARIEQRDGEERFVMGVVLEPETVDSQGDIYSEKEVRDAAHTFMERFGNIGLQHKTMVNDHVKTLESFLTRQVEKFGEQEVPPGTWVMGVRILSDQLWASVKKGDLTGFSIGGTAIKRPLKSSV